MDVDGVALATVLSNVVNAALMVYWLTREPEPYRLNLKDTSINRNELKKILQIGVPAGIQGVLACQHFHTELYQQIRLLCRSRIGSGSILRGLLLLHRERILPGGSRLPEPELRSRTI